VKKDWVFEKAIKLIVLFPSFREKKKVNDAEGKTEIKIF
jgi:hypothetical protein